MSDNNISSVGGNAGSGAESAAIRRAKLEARLHELGLARRTFDLDNEAHQRATDYMRRAATSDRADISGARSTPQSVRTSEEARAASEVARRILDRTADSGSSGVVNRANEIELIELLSG